MPRKFENGYYDLQVIATDADGYEFNGSLPYIECRSNKNSIYVITDKPVYKDSEKGLLT